MVVATDGVVVAEALVVAVAMVVVAAEVAMEAVAMVVVEVALVAVGLPGLHMVAPALMAMVLAPPTQHQQLLHQLQCPPLLLPMVQSARMVLQHLHMEWTLAAAETEAGIAAVGMIGTETAAGTTAVAGPAPGLHLAGAGIIAEAF